MGAAPAVAWTPPADVSESEDAFHIDIELPGVKSRDIDVEANGPELVVTGEIKERERKGVLRRSTRRVGAFEYRLRLPGELDTHKIKAEMQDGLRRERRGSGHPSGTAAGPARLDTPHGGGDALRGSPPLVVLPAGLADLIRGVRGSERTLLLPSQAVPRRRYPVRQTRRPLPRRTPPRLTHPPATTAMVIKQTEPSGSSALEQVKWSKGGLCGHLSLKSSLRRPASAAPAEPWRCRRRRRRRDPTAGPWCSSGMCRVVRTPGSGMPPPVP